jgi:hypothetical protein
MKTHVMSMFLALSTVSFGGALFAQTYEMKGNIPFAFQVNNQTFEAGKYIVRRGSEFIPKLVSVETGRGVFIIGANAVLSGKQPGKLVFHRYNADKYFLAEVWPASGNGTCVPKSKAEKALANGDGTRAMATIVVDLYRAD